MIIFQKDDEKFRSIKEALLKYKIKSVAVTGSPIKAPFVLLKYLFLEESSIVYVFRYLNDYPSLFKTILRIISESLTILIAKIFKVKVWWICHNVDKETESNFPKLTNWRRDLIANNVSQIFTTNELLIPYAKDILKKKNIDYISLGFIRKPLYNNLKFNKSANYELNNWLIKNKCYKTKIIFVAGTYTKKVLHFDLIKKLIESLNKSDEKHIWKAVVVGYEISYDPNIFNISEKYLVDPVFINKYIDYYYRVIDDFSISYTLFESCYYKKPIITEKYGFLPFVITFYKLGYVVNTDQIPLFLEEINKQVNFGFDNFLQINNWELTANKIEYYYNK